MENALKKVDAKKENSSLKQSELNQDLQSDLMKSFDPSLDHEDKNLRNVRISNSPLVSPKSNLDLSFEPTVKEDKTVKAKPKARYLNIDLNQPDGTDSFQLMKHHTKS